MAISGAQPVQSRVQSFSGEALNYDSLSVNFAFNGEIEELVIEPIGTFGYRGCGGLNRVIYRASVLSIRRMYFPRDRKLFSAGACASLDPIVNCTTAPNKQNRRGLRVVAKFPVLLGKLV